MGEETSMGNSWGRRRSLDRDPGPQQPEDKSEDAGSGEEGHLAMGCPYVVTGRGRNKVYISDILSPFS